MTQESQTIDVHIRALANGDLGVREFATFIYDLNLLYELYVQQTVDPESLYRGNATGWIFSRTGRDIPRDARLIVGTVELRSPLELLAQIPIWIPSLGIAVAGLWGLIQSVEKLYNIGEGHRLLVAQRRLAEVQAKLAERQLNDLDDVPQLASSGSERGRFGRSNIDPIPATERRLQRAQFRIVELEIDVPDDL